MFPDTTAYFGPGYYDQNALNGFAVATAAQQTSARAAFTAISQFTNLNFTEISASAITGAYSPATDITIARSSHPATAYAYYPYSDPVGGDVWMGTSGGNSNSVKGNYAWHTMWHELGHALGLKHGHETGGVSNQALTSNRDSMEFSVMTYRSYVNHNLTTYPYYTNESWGYAQSFMMYDIAALQAMYGADFTTNSGSTVYTFSPTTGEMFINGVGQGAPGANRIFLTIWDGGGNDTYDFSNYTTNLSIDLTPGGWSTLSSSQLANLGNGNYARGNVYNALQYNGDVRSLIENAIGGSGNDTIIGNAANNRLTGNAGNDTLVGGDGFDFAVYSGLSSSVTYGHNASGQIVVNAGANGTDTLIGMQILDFADRDVFLWKRSAVDLVGDFSGNGRDDILWRSSYGSVVIWDYGSSGSFVTPTLANLGFNWVARGVADFDGDGRDDILWRDVHGTVALWQMNGTIASATGLGYVATHWDIAAVGDFNGDGRADILWQDTTGNLTTWLMNGPTISGSTYAAALWNGYVIQGVGDFNGDGTDDILTRDAATGTMAIYGMTNGVVTSYTGIGSTGLDWSVRGIADFNNDGRDDLLVRHVDGRVAIWTMGPNYTVQSVGVVAPVQNFWEIHGVGNFVAGGGADILWRHTQSGQVVVWGMDGTNIVSTPTLGVVSTSDWFIL